MIEVTTLHPIRLEPRDVDRYGELRRRMLREAPWAFSASPEDDRAVDGLREKLRTEEHAIFAMEAPELDDSATEIHGAGGPPELIAAAGIMRMTGAKHAHRARAWGVFVDFRYRGKGYGRAVVQAALDHARCWSGVDYVDLSVSEHAPEAMHLYESLGFVAWGREPESLAHGGRRYDEIYMCLRLEAAR